MPSLLPASDRRGQERGQDFQLWLRGLATKGAPDPWYKISGMPGKYATGECSCDNFLINEIADTVLEAMPIIAHVCVESVNNSFPGTKRDG